MLWKLLWLVALLPQQSHQDTTQEVDFVKTPHGPQTLEEEAKARKALHREHGDIKFPEDWDGTADFLNNPEFRWPDGVVPYVIDQSVSHLDDKITAAMKQYHQDTCIQFVPRTNHTDFVKIFKGDGCESAIGRKGGMQELSLDNGCGYVGLVVHELGHAIGLVHDHQRPDRDKYIVVYEQNVQPGQLKNVEKAISKDDERVISAPYDYDSIMHYGNFAFSKDPKKLRTMVAKNGQKLYEPFEKPGLEKSDINDINQLYSC